jgi:hypothetical protein
MIDGRSHYEIEWNESIEDAVLWESAKEGACFARSGDFVEELVVFIEAFVYHAAIITAG